MSVFEKIIEHVSRKNYYLVKDYTKNIDYIVDAGIANYLFGGYGGRLKSDCVFTFNHLTHTAVAEMDHEEFNKSMLIVFRDYSNSFGTKPNPGLQERINELENEKKNGIDSKTRAKTPQEIKEYRTVRLIGAYHSFETAKKDCREVLEYESKHGHCAEEEMIIVRHPSTEVPKDFKGKVSPSPSFD